MALKIPSHRLKTPVGAHICVEPRFESDWGRPIPKGQKMSIVFLSAQTTATQSRQVDPRRRSTALPVITRPDVVFQFGSRDLYHKLIFPQPIR